MRAVLFHLESGRAKVEHDLSPEGSVDEPGERLRRLHSFRTGLRPRSVRCRGDSPARAQPRTRRPIALGHDAGLDARAGDDWLAEAATWIDHDALRACEIDANPGIEPFGDVAAPLDALEAGVQCFAQEGLLRARHIEELARVIDEQAHAIRAEARVD